MKNVKNKPEKTPTEEEDDKSEGTGSYIGGHFDDDKNDNGGAEIGEYEELDDETPGPAGTEKEENKKVIIAIVI